MRLFIAALLPDYIVEEIGNYIDSLKDNIDGVKWEKPEKLHLTLKFLGDVDEEQIDEISALLNVLAKTYSPFKVNLKEFGGFPRLKNPKVLYVGLSQNEELTKFHSELDHGMFEIGFEKEERKFIPHVTIGRVKKRISIDKVYKISKITFELNQIGIIKSELRREGSVYTPLKIFKLGK